MRQVQVTEKLSSRYKHFVDNGMFTIRPKKILNKSDNICCIGSCFAEEIRNALDGKFEVGPDLSNLEIDTEIEKIDELPGRNHTNFYNPTNVKNELAIAAGDFQYSDDDIFEVNKKNELHPERRFAFQDPYRRQVYGATKSDLLRARRRLENELKNGFQNADVFIITLGLNEVIRRRSNGNTLNQYPAYGGNSDREDCYPHWLTFEEACHEIREIVYYCEKLSRKDTPEIILTVSPVPMDRTFSRELDVYTVNLQSKANLIAATHRVVSEIKNCSYFESFEIVSGLGSSAFETDGRHVRRDVVANIVKVFELTFVK